MIPRSPSLRILFDESHSESWTPSRQRAAEIQPDNPVNSSYGLAADILAQGDFEVGRNTSQAFSDDLLADVDVVAIVHPCDPQWERTTSTGPVQLGQAEIDSLVEFVRRGGGLFVASEYEHAKYGNNLNNLLVSFGLQFENTTTSDKSHCHQGNRTWVMARPSANAGRSGLLARVKDVVFYRACSIRATDPRSIVLQSHTHPPSVGLLAVAEYGKGRIVVVADSDLFGDDYIDSQDHRSLWRNLMYWLAASSEKARAAQGLHDRTIELPDGWVAIRDTTEALRALQANDGAVSASTLHLEATRLVVTLRAAIETIAVAFPEQRNYFSALDADLDAWVQGAFGRPEFARSLAEFNPQLSRKHQERHLAVFPLYTPNASPHTRFDAMIFETLWPDWLEELERTLYNNDKFVSGQLVDYTAGYSSECAVLFPETVSLSTGATNNFGVIFSDREAQRYQRYTILGWELLQLNAPPDLEFFLTSFDRIRDAYSLWDLVHDRSHALGELPFDPFMIRRLSPFWMYGLEELRVDLSTYNEAEKLVALGFDFARFVKYAILFDRLFRFPISGSRVRNYDGLGGQLLFGYLHRHGALRWINNMLDIDWLAVDQVVDSLRLDLQRLYTSGVTESRVRFWFEGHDFISEYVPPHVGSRWKRDGRALTDEADPKSLLGEVLDDEFPLSSFYVLFLQKLRKRGA